MAMRSNTEKLAVFRKLRDSGKARADLQLLERQQPGNADLHRVRINPERYAVGEYCPVSRELIVFCVVPAFFASSV